MDVPGYLSHSRRTLDRNATHINVIHADVLQDLGLDRVSDPDLGHDGDGHGGHDLSDHTWVRLRVSTEPSLSSNWLTIRATPPSRRMFAGIRSTSTIQRLLSPALRTYPGP